MFDLLWKKMVTSRKFLTLAITLILKLVSPLVTRYGIDLTWVETTLNEWIPVIIAYLIGQSAVDVAKELREQPPTEPLPPPPLP